MKTKNFFLKNGAAVLEQIIIDFNGNCNPIRTYSGKELAKATDDFNWSRMLHWDSGYQMYKGVHEDREISVKRFDSTSNRGWTSLKWIANEIAVASQMSKHKNVLKLLGCCLETELPMLVYEFPVKGSLSNYLNRSNGNEQVLPFETRLEIAIGVANSVAYLHHGLSKTFIHRDLHPGHLFLGQDYVAKLSEFRLSIPIPEGKTHVDADCVYGSFGYMAEEVAVRGRYTERSDVYNVEFLLFELLIGKRLDLMSWNSDRVSKEGSSNSEDESGKAWDCHVENLWKRHLKTSILKGGERAQQVECIKLIKRRVKTNADERPNMIEVAKALVLIKSIQC